MILKISLRPLNKFFFGGEASFNEPGAEDTRRSTYLLHSRFFPQQTGALGLIRNQLLIQSGLLRDNTARVSDKIRAKALIGSHGFRKGYVGTYGAIRRISPVFLEAEDGELCVPAPRDDRRMPDPEKKEVLHAMKFDLHGVASAQPGESQSQHARLSHYREKVGLEAQFQHPTLGNAPLKKLFHADKRVGVTKAARPWGNPVEDEDDEAGFYYQTFLGFERPKKSEPEEADLPPFQAAKFVFYVELNEKYIAEISQGKNEELTEVPYEWTDQPVRDNQKNQFTLQDAIVEFGGERSTFQMEVASGGEAFPDFLTVYRHTKMAKDPKLGTIKRLVCLSPCWVEDLSALRAATHLIVSETLPFRFLQSSVDATDEYQGVSRGSGKKTGALLESKQFQMLDRGSVCYFDAGQEATVKALFASADLQNIGYNQIHIQ